MLEGYVIGGAMKLGIDTEVIAGVDRGGEDLYLTIEAEFMPGNNDSSDSALDIVLSDRKRGIYDMLMCYMEGSSRSLDIEIPEWQTEKDVREGSETIQFWQDKVILPQTPHYMIAKTFTFPEFIDFFMEAVSDRASWQLSRRYGEVGFTWKLNRHVFVDGNAD